MGKVKKKRNRDLFADKQNMFQMTSDMRLQQKVHFAVVFVFILISVFRLGRMKNFNFLCTKYNTFIQVGAFYVK